jgi:hypothetical protein
MPVCQNPKKKTVSPEVIEVAPPAGSKELKKALVVTNPLTCPTCYGEIRIISFVGQPEVTKKDLIFDPCSAGLKTSLLQTEINVHLYPEIELELT